MSFVRESVTIGGREVTIETGKWAKQAGGSVVIRLGDSMVLVAATGSSGPRDLPFLPLTCEYREKTYAAGKIPGGYFKREGRPAEREILGARQMDRPIRPLFPAGWRYDTQIHATIVSHDGENDTDVLAMTGGSCAVHLSDLDWDGPIAGIRVGRIDGEFIAFPTFSERADSELDMIVAVSRDAIVMVEGGAKELSEATIIDALMFAHEAAQPLLDLQEKLRAAVGKPKRGFTSPVLDEAVVARVREIVGGGLEDALTTTDKHARYAALDELKARAKGELCEAEGADFADRGDEVSEAFAKLKKEVARNLTIDRGKRIDGRAFDEIRNISIEVGVLPAVHGSALFTRGETQALAAVTLGTASDAQRIDTLRGDQHKGFMLHYNFPSFCTGEVKPIRGTSRREIGHGFLAERSVRKVLPTKDDFPYTIRVVSEVLESNGSSSMASVCGASLSLMDAGVPVKEAVAGIAMGMMKQGDKIAILSDILGDEDHLGDMDFKVTGTRDGVCALQMDIKIKGLSRDILEQALDQARRGRIHILDEMAKIIAAPRDNLSPHAPRIVTITIRPDKIRDIIGPGGKTIRAIVEQTGAQIDISDDGSVAIASANERSLQQAIDIINGLTMEAEVGAFYRGIVKRVVEFGAFIEILPGTDGLLHISEIAEERTKRVTDVMKEGDEVLVKCLSVDRDGKIRLSRKEALNAEPEVVHSLVS